MCNEEGSLSTSRNSVSSAIRRRVQLNVGGKLFETWDVNFLKHPNTLLGSTDKEMYYDSQKQMYCFDRDPEIFRHILNYYRVNRLHYTHDYCAEEFREELNFFRISINAVDSCCWEYYRQPQKVRIEKVFELNDESKWMEHTPNTCALRKDLWDLFEYPERNTSGKIWYYVSATLIALSIVCTVVETIPLQCEDLYKNSGSYNMSTSMIEDLENCQRGNEAIFFVIECICVGVFTLEYIGRLLSAPNIFIFVKDFMSLIDLASILPFYLGLFMTYVFRVSIDSLSSLVLLRILRVFRVLKLTRHSTRLRSLVFSIKRSTSELTFIVFSFSLGVTLISSLLYFIEIEQNDTKFDSIPASMWYSVVTMTTTGYGDMVPVTSWGKLVASIGCIIGVLMIALPVPIIQKKANLELGLLDEVDEAFRGD